MQNWKITTDEAPIGDSSAYGSTAIADANFAGSEHPKLKFNFSMEIEYRGDTTESKIGSDAMELMNIPLKSASRPNPTFNTVDVNYYNYRTKVINKTDYGTMTVVFYDDAAERAHGIVDTCLAEISPISRGLTMEELDNPSSIPFGTLSSVGPLFTSRHGIIRTLKVHHHYVKRGQARRTTYVYANPKMISFDLGELSMSENDVTTVSITFAYDGYYMEYDGAPGIVEVGGVTPA